MKRYVLVFVAGALVAAACSSSSDSQVASIDEIIPDSAKVVQDDSVANEEIILEFSQCMRDNGTPDFEDPIIGEDGSIEFKFGDQGAGTSEEREAMREAFDACQDSLEGFAFGPDSFDRAEIEDTLYEFAVCMRDEGIDVPDPDFSAMFSGGGGGGGDGGPFGGALDRDDPEVMAALVACRDVFGGSFRLGGGNG